MKTRHATLVVLSLTLLGGALRAETLLSDPVSGARVRLRVDPQIPSERGTLEGVFAANAQGLLRCLRAADQSEGGLPASTTLVVDFRALRADAVPPHGSAALTRCVSTWLATQRPKPVSTSAILRLVLVAGFKRRSPDRYAPTPPIPTQPRMGPPQPRPTAPQPPKTAPQPPNTEPQPPNTEPQPPNTGPQPPYAPTNPGTRTRPEYPPQPLGPAPYRRSPTPQPTPEQLATITLTVRGTKGPKNERRRVAQICTDAGIQLRACAVRLLKRAKGAIVFEIEPQTGSGFVINTRQNSTNDRLSVCLKQVLIPRMRRIAFTASVTFSVGFKRTTPRKPR